MPLVYKDDHGQFYVQVGAVVALEGNYGDLNSFASWDIVAAFLQNTTLAGSFYPVESTVGAYLDRGEPVLHIVGAGKPPKIDYNNVVDARRYSSGISSLVSLRRVLRNEPVCLRFDPGKEHQTVHASYRGTLGPSLGNDLLLVPGDWAPLQSTSSWPGGNSPGYMRAPNPDGSEHVNFVDGWYLKAVTGSLSTDGIHFSVDLSSHYQWAPRRDLRSTFEYLADFPVIWSATSGPTFFQLGIAFGFTITDEDDGFSVVYQIHWEYGPRNYAAVGFPFPDTDALYAMDVVVKRRFFNSFTMPVADHHFDFGDLEFISNDITGAECTVDWYPLSFSPSPAAFPIPLGVHTTRSVTLSDMVYLSRASQSGWGTDPPDLDTFMRRPYLRSFREEVQSYIGDIRLSSYQSTVDALNSASPSIGINLLQTLSKASQIGELLPDLNASLRGVLGSRGLTSGVSAFDLLNHVTSLKLQQSFVVRPDIDFVLDTLPKLKSLLEDIEHLTSDGLMVCRGSFHYDFPAWEFGREKTTLVTRSKLVCTRNYPELVQKILVLNTFGVAPSAANIWDLVPYSFVLNWFSGIGARLRDLETIASIALMDLRVLVHTYTVDSFLTTNELLRDRLFYQSQIGDHPYMRVFVRDVSAYYPRVAASGRYDFRLPTRLPDLGSAASLLWSLTGGSF